MTSMPQPGENDQDSSPTEDIILGGDTPKDLHVAAVITSLGALRETLSGLSNLRLIRRCAHLDIDTPQDTTSAAAYTLRLLARRILTLTDEIRELQHQITTAVTPTPPLLTRSGIGPDNTAALLIAAGDNPDRLRSEASFVALCGVSPLEASSGKTKPSPPVPRR